jgi:Kef-type K+ transport system membrane component KefB
MPLLFLLVLAVAVIGKMLGSVISVFFADITFSQSTLIGWAMNSRGAVELIIAEVARQNNLIPIEIYSVIVAMALITTFIFPLVLNIYLKKQPDIMN